jgi:transcriptional regulator with GAF, ATPase, and Fis domain
MSRVRISLPRRDERGVGSWELVETTEFKQAKSEINRLNEELEQRVIERTRELTAANEQLKRAFEEIDKLRQRLESENEYLLEEVRAASGDSTILGNSPAIRRVLERIEMVAPTDATVLILGETGVGKELVARNIHERSPRREHPLIKVNCTAIPRELFESEFFGHVRGAFSGAFRDRAGRFQLADGGSLFLDEVGDLPPEMQPKLLRVLQHGEFEPVGDEKTRRANFRLIGASNHDLETAARAGRFRQDLYYRLSVFPIEVPPLRERKEDTPILAAHFLEMACKRFNRQGLQLTESQFRRLQNYEWPGNVRELENVLEQAVITARTGSLRFDIPDSGRIAEFVVAGR